VNTLIGAMNDPEPTVRAVATRSLAMLGDTRGTMALVSRLRDDVRVVRVAAAESLLWMGVSTLPGVAGDVLTRVQDEYARSLENFPQEAGNHTSLGWLASERGQQEQAARALDIAIDLEPKYARAHVFRGVVAARSGQFGEAIKHWQTARSIDPAYPNLDKMIEEARKR
jgi:tetratricopeptide (TPR) repeat protein